MENFQILEVFLKRDEHVRCAECKYLEKHLPATFILCSKYNIRLYDNMDELPMYCGQGEKKEAAP
jgi:hypothetical protein